MRSSLHLQIPTVQEEEKQLVETAAQHGPWREVDGPHESMKIAPAHTTDHKSVIPDRPYQRYRDATRETGDVSGDVTNVTTCTQRQQGGNSTTHFIQSECTCMRFVSAITLDTSER